MNQFKEAHPITNAMFVLLPKNYPRMKHSLSGHIYKISIMRAKDSAHRGGSLQMVFVTIAQCL